MPETSITFLERLRDHPDEQTWQHFVDLYSPLIRGWLRRYAVGEQDAEDLTQEVMAVLIRSFPSFAHNRRPGAFRNWLRTVTVNQLRLSWRKKKGPTATGDSAVMRMLELLADPESSLSKLWDQQHDQHVAARLMALLQPRFEPATWQAFRRVALEGAKAATVAQELGISVNAVLLAKSRVLAGLRRELRELTD